MAFDFGNISPKIKEVIIHAENADPENVPWDEFVAKCRDAGYRIIEENPEANLVLIVHETYGD